MDTLAKECGCKGIRTCLLCEKDTELCSEFKNDKERITYLYCPYCNLCWPESKDSNPLYLGKILLIPDFINKEEESYLVSSIDQIPWMPSQSGRRKQDFGPKANFKKKKVKLGNFKGFPLFAKYIIERLRAVEDLADFIPVELCHLEYTPERGSAIEPHIDDLWLWGDSLVTINLLAQTVLTLTPTTNTCMDSSQEIKDNCDSVSSCLRFDGKSNLCDHQASFENFRNSSGDPPFHVKSICSEYGEKIAQPVVRIVLPPRSLFVLSGCARTNWFHEIKRKDVTSRRIAMTFRELEKHFYIENNETEKLCNDLLSISKQFGDFSKENSIDES